MVSPHDMSADPGRAGYRTVLSWRRTALTTAAAGSAATYSAFDLISTETVWLLPIVLAAVLIAAFVLATSRGSALARGHIHDCGPLAFGMASSICLISGVLIVVLVAERLWPY